MDERIMVPKGERKFDAIFADLLMATTIFNKVAGLSLVLQTLTSSKRLCDDIDLVKRSLLNSLENPNSDDANPKSS
jgi:hypothetical protein